MLSVLSIMSMVKDCETLVRALSMSASSMLTHIIMRCLESLLVFLLFDVHAHGQVTILLNRDIDSKRTMYANMIWQVGFDKDAYNGFMEGFEPLLSEDVAEGAAWMLQAKERVSIKALDVVPSAQRSLSVFDRDWNKRNGVKE